jgi:hypothetical protein
LKSNVFSEPIDNQQINLLRVAFNELWQANKMYLPTVLSCLPNQRMLFKPILKESFSTKLEGYPVCRI